MRHSSNDYDARDNARGKSGTLHSSSKLYVQAARHPGPSQASDTAAVISVDLTDEDRNLARQIIDTPATQYQRARRIFRSVAVLFPSLNFRRGFFLPSGILNIVSELLVAGSAS
jgi:hypothetical protein